ncbi:uncharacterized protein VTP21DRAFT_3243 [Calcarisporiella thermophila]|uniref:uncharacterized protein n=1 Tax=Calcarisporiella thermophila TaxID=911321 RepID=UPI003743BFD2
MLSTQPSRLNQPDSPPLTECDPEELLDEPEPPNSTPAAKESSSADPDEACSDDSTPPEPRPTIIAKLSPDDASDWNFILTSAGLRFQLRLRSLGDLHRLLSASYIFDNASLPEFPPTFPRDNAECKPLPRCTIFSWHFPKPVRQDMLIPAVKNYGGFTRSLVDYLFHFYVSGCLNYFQHPDRPAFLESYYRGEIEPVLLYTAITRAALHLLLKHMDCSMLRQIQNVIEHLLVRAITLLEEAFDSPSPQSVLAFLNMSCCMRRMYQLEKAYTYHKQAVLMALALRMNQDDPSERDSMRIELQRRIWCFLCKNELLNSGVYGRPWILTLETIRNSPKVTLGPCDTNEYRLFLISFELDIAYHTKLARFSNIDWSQPDQAIVRNLVSIAALLQHDVHVNLGYILGVVTSIHQKHMINIKHDFWINWCYLWQQFIESDAPPRRMGSELMQQLRAKALDEYLKGVTNVTSCWRTALRDRAGCSKYLPSHNFCHMYKFIASHHPNRTIRRHIFGQLGQIFRLLKSDQSPATLGVKLQIHEVVKALEEMKPFVFTEQELEMMKGPKLKPIAIRHR